LGRTAEGALLRGLQLSSRRSRAPCREAPWVGKALGLAGIRSRGGRIREPHSPARFPDGSLGVIPYTEGPTPIAFKPRSLGFDDDGRELWQVPEQAVREIYDAITGIEAALPLIDLIHGSLLAYSIDVSSEASLPPIH